MHKTSVRELEDHFPWFSEELAQIVHKKLNAAEIKRLLQELQETCNISLQHWCKSQQGLGSHAIYHKVREIANGS